MSDPSEPATETTREPEAETPEPSFEDLANERQIGLIEEFVLFLGESKKWWLTPIIVVLLLVGLLIILSSSVIAPFIYPIF